MRVDVIHGPNLAILGQREPEIYGAATLPQIDEALLELGRELGVEVETFQSNHEGQILDRLQERSGATDGFLINAGGLTHTSVALRDALAASDRPFVEVHLSNVSARESFRQVSYLSGIAAGVVYGFGVDSYLLGLRGLISLLQSAP